MKFVKLDSSTLVSYFAYFKAGIEGCKALFEYLDFLVSKSAYEPIACDEHVSALFFPQGRRSQPVFEKELLLIDLFINTIQAQRF